LFFHSPITPLRLTFLRTLLSYLYPKKNSEAENRSGYEISFEKGFLDAVTFKRLEKMGAFTLYLSNIAGMRGATKEAINFWQQRIRYSRYREQRRGVRDDKADRRRGYKGRGYYSEG
jgi:hypothetical protein